MIRARWLLPFLLLAAPRAPAERLTVATYNVENYGAVDRRTPEGFRAAYPKPEAEKGALREVLRALAADIVALQEMDGPAGLEELRRDLAAEGLDYPFSACLSGPDPVRRLAVLSRRPWVGLVRHADLPIAYREGGFRVKRGLLEATVATAGGPLTLFIVHLKSRLTERPDDPGAAERREAEACAVRACVRARFPDPGAGRYVILGDCNDGPRDPALRRLSAHGATAIAWRLPARDARGETWTEWYRRGDAYAALDHILVSPALRGRVVGGAARIYDGPGASEASDHRAVLASLECSD